MKCRFCQNHLSLTLIDLGAQPLSNSYLSETDLQRPEPVFPMDVKVCDKCFLVQLDEYQGSADIFTEYAYFSSYSDSWLEHCKGYASKISDRLRLGSKSLVVEIASNDGYLLQFFRDRNIQVLGIEPAKNVAKVAVEKGIPTVTEFFGVKLADKLVEEGTRADLVCANNVLAHVPDINDFVEGIQRILSDEGVVTIEFPHLQKLISLSQFDTIYHEHFSYLSLFTVEQIFKEHGLRVFDCERLETHGGSLRIYGCRVNAKTHERSAGMEAIAQDELDWGVKKIETYLGFQLKAAKIKEDLMSFLEQTKKSGKKIVGYGAPAKGNTLLNYCGINAKLLPYTVDKNTYKQGKLLPGSKIPIKTPEEIFVDKPDYVLILPWNIKAEIEKQISEVRKWGGKFVTAIPQLTIW